MKNRASRPASILLLALSSLCASSALAVPKEGETAPNARFEDVDGHAFELKSFKGKPILIVYEDKDSAQQNQPLKEDLAKLAKGDRYRAAIALAAVADVSAYDFWPAKAS